MIGKQTGLIEDAMYLVTKILTKKGATPNKYKQKAKNLPVSTEQ